ncbi:MAG: hypothetical protein K6G92_06115 [Bacteroidaceae bacterium]|nr:hypothetical protein [Bacteroidaceae bacterium]
MDYSSSLQSLWTEVKNYLELQKQYLVMDTAEKMTVLLSAVSTAALCLALGAMALFFLLFALASWFGQMIGSLFVGYLVMGIVLLLMMVVAFVKRKQWILQPIARLVVGLFIHEDEEEEEAAS